MGTNLTAVLLAAAIGAPPAIEEPPFLIPSARAGASDLFLIDAVKGDAKNVTKTEQAEEVYPAWSPDGKRIAFVCKTKDHELEVYVCDADGSNRKRLTEAESPSGCFTPSWSADGKCIAYQRLLAGGKCEVRVVNSDGTSDRLLVADANGPAWSPDGSCIAFTTKKAGKPPALCTVKPDGGDIKTLVENLGGEVPFFPAWSPDGKQIALSIATDHGLQVALVPAAGGTPRQLTHVPGININPVWLAADRILFSHTPQPGAPGGAYVCMKTDGTRLMIHALTKLEPPHLVGRPAVFLPRPAKAVENPVKPVSFVEPGMSKPSPIKIVPVAVLPPAAPGAIVGASWASDNKRIALAFEAGLVVTLEHENNVMKPVDVFRGHEGGVSGVAVAPDGKFLFSSSADKSVRIWDLTIKGSNAVETDQDSPLESIAVSANGKLLATGDRDGKVKVRDAATAKPQREITVGDGKRAVHALAFGKDDAVLFAGCAKWGMPVLNGCVAAYDPTTGKELWRTKGTFGGVFSLAVSPDGTKVAGACLDTFIRTWDAKTGQELSCWKGHADRATGVCWVLGGKGVVSCGFDHTVRLWDPATGSNLAVLAAHASPVVRVAASPDGTRVISLGQVGSLCMWKLTRDPN